MAEEARPIKNKIVKNSFWNFLMTFFGKMGGLIFAILLARFLLPEKFGIYRLAMSITLILLTFADVGINQTLIRYFSDSLKKTGIKKAISEYKYLLKLKLFLTLILAGLLLIFAYPLAMYVFQKPLLFYPLLFSSIYLLIYSFESFYSAFFYIVEKVGYLTIKQFMFEVIRIFGALAVFIFIASQYHILGIIGILTLSTAFALVFAIYNLNKLLPSLFEKSKEKLVDYDKKRINLFLSYLVVGGSLIVIFGYVDIVMLGIFLSSEFVGFYAAALALATGLATLINIANVLLPVFTQSKKDNLNQIFAQVFKYTTLITIPMIFGVLFLGNYLIKSIYGQNYLPATLPLYFLAFLMLEIPITNSLKSLFTAREQPKYFVKILIGATIMNILLNYILITSLLKISMNWAIAGAAIATLTSRYFYFFGLSFHAKKQLNVSINLKNLIKPIIASIIMISILFGINSYIGDINYLIGICEIVGGILIYFLIMFLIKGITKKDLLLIKEVIR